MLHDSLPEGTPIAGWFMMKKKRHGKWITFWGPPIYGNLIKGELMVHRFTNVVRKMEEYLMLELLLGYTKQ